MECFYFPEEIYRLAHIDHIERTGKSLQEVYTYCMTHPDFFVEVAFAYVDGLPYPKMKESTR